MTKQHKSIDTKLIHAGEPSERFAGAVSLPIFQSSTFEYGGESSYHDIKYIRLNNTPNHTALHSKLAQLENAEDALVAASGMAAISTALLAVLSAGDHLLAQDSLYGGTHDLLNKDLSALGISFDHVSLDHPESWKAKLRENTRAFYVETITNPLIQVGDLQSVVDFCRRNDLVSMIDNTFASPFNFRPSEWGFDLSLHSCTKYLNGHTDIVAGACIGRADLIQKVTHKLDHLGGTLDPHTCFLLNRGIKTLAVRMRHQNESAQKVATFLEGHQAVERVNYPGLAGHPHHARASRLLDGFSGMLSFELKGSVDEADDFMSALTIPISAPSLGGVETLITRPATTSHSGMTRDQRSAAGISDNLIRLSVGLESPEDLIADFEKALNVVSAARSHASAV